MWSTNQIPAPAWFVPMLGVPLERYRREPAGTDATRDVARCYASCSTGDDGVAAEPPRLGGAERPRFIGHSHRGRSGQAGVDGRRKWR
ncbi:MAG: hypothetical protein JRD89_12025 [Deltaproteobacteria bacterium]|nr:hypothetical protein [Deltaproteobacteria bacterium]